MCIVAVDVHYDDDNDKALAAAVAFDNFSDSKASHEWTVVIDGIEEYIPGSFYKRELPCLMKLLEVAPCDVDMIIIDGHVWLRENQHGLGQFLFEALGSKVPVIGVAKNPFNNGHALTTFRGRSTRPLWVTSSGIDRKEARQIVNKLHGPHRIPTLLKRVDSLSRGN